MTSAQDRMRRLAAPWSGIASALGGLGLAELIAAFSAPAASPLASTGAALIDLAPGWAKELVVGLFGTNDKIAIIAGLIVAVLVLAAAAGVAEAHRRFTGMVVFALLGGAASLAAVTRAGSTPASCIPAIVGTLVVVLALRRFSRELPTASKPSPGTGRPGLRRRSEGAQSRRSFLLATGITASAGVVAGLVAQASTAAGRAVEAARSSFALPRAALRVEPPTAAMSFDIEGLSPLITSNENFYRIDTALIVPEVDPDTWTLRIHGLVENEITITYADLLALPMEESNITLMCVSNDVGGDLISTATWMGYPIRELLARAVPSADADMVLSSSADGWTAGTPLETLTDDRNAILAVGMNGELLPAEHGFPARLVVPGLYGYVSATKWVIDLNVTRFDRATAYWTDRGWGAKGPIKLSSRIDVARVESGPGDVTVAGVAWAPHTGISRVEVQVDGGEWSEATLADELSVDTWRQWMWAWPATSGSHTLTVRATDTAGVVQIPDRQGVLPDGATGYHSITVKV